MQIEVERGNRIKPYLKREGMLPRLCGEGREGWGARMGEDGACKVRVLPEGKHVTWKGAVRPERPAFSSTLSMSALLCSGVFSILLFISTSVSQCSPGPSYLCGRGKMVSGSNIWAQVGRRE